METEKSLSAEALYKEVRHSFVMVKPATGKGARQPLEVDPSPIFPQLHKTSLCINTAKSFLQLIRPRETSD